MNTNTLTLNHLIITRRQAEAIGDIIDGYGPLAGSQVVVANVPGEATLSVYYAPMDHDYRVLTDGTTTRQPIGPRVVTDDTLNLDADGEYYDNRSYVPCEG